MPKVLCFAQVYTGDCTGFVQGVGDLRLPKSHAYSTFVKVHGIDVISDRGLYLN